MGTHYLKKMFNDISNGIDCVELMKIELSIDSIVNCELAGVDRLCHDMSGGAIDGLDTKDEINRAEWNDYVTFFLNLGMLTDCLNLLDLEKNQCPLVAARELKRQVLCDNIIPLLGAMYDVLINPNLSDRGYDLCGADHIVNRLELCLEDLDWLLVSDKQLTKTLKIVLYKRVELNVGGVIDSINKELHLKENNGKDLDSIMVVAEMRALMDSAQTNAEEHLNQRELYSDLMELVDDVSRVFS